MNCIQNCAANLRLEAAPELKQQKLSLETRCKFLLVICPNKVDCTAVLNFGEIIPIDHVHYAIAARRNKQLLI
jgi:hypothetical protein